MISWYKLPVAFSVALIVSVAARADLMTACDADIEVRRQVSARSEATETQPTDSHTLLVDGHSLADFDLNPNSISPQPHPAKDFSELSLTQDAQILTDGQKSVNLCLSALIGLGLCSSAHCLKKFNFGFIPEWYHNGGPFQIGHSFAVNPDTLCPAPAYCFVQPDHEADDPIPITRTRDIISLWRESQFTPDVLYSRGPPAAC